MTHSNSRNQCVAVYFVSHFKTLKRHILLKHNEESSVKPLLRINKINQDKLITHFWKQAMWHLNVELLKSGSIYFIMERKSKEKKNDSACMCSNCKVLFAHYIKRRDVMMLMVSLHRPDFVEQHTQGFKELLNTISQLY